jgi:UDP-N-acetyl-D-galactosamine dehydrogenase
VVDIISELKSFGLQVDVVDPKASAKDVKAEYGISLADKPDPPYQAVIAAVSHKEYLNLDEDYFKSLGPDNLILVDIKGIYKKKIKVLHYMSL